GYLQPPWRLQSFLHVQTCLVAGIAALPVGAVELDAPEVPPSFLSQPASAPTRMPEMAEARRMCEVFMSLISSSLQCTAGKKRVIHFRGPRRWAEYRSPRRRAGYRSEARRTVPLRPIHE